MSKLSQLAKKLRFHRTVEDGELSNVIDTTYLVVVNNDEAKVFSSESEVLDYVRQYSKLNSVKSLNVFKSVLYDLN